MLRKWIHKHSYRIGTSIFLFPSIVADGRAIYIDEHWLTVFLSAVVLSLIWQWAYVEHAHMVMRDHEDRPT